MSDPWAERLARIFRGNAERTFLIDAASGREVTYDGLLVHASSAAIALQRRGIRLGDHLGVYLQNSAEFAILYFACLLGGFVAVPINNALSRKDRAFILLRSKLAALVVGQGRLMDLEDLVGDDAAAPAGLPTVHALGSFRNGTTGGAVNADALTLEGASRADCENLLAALEGRRLFSIHFTSGTTSLPKGVPHRVSSLLGNADAFNRAFGIGRDDRFLHVMPMSYMAGFLNSLLCPFMAEASVVLAPQFTAQSVLRFWESVVAHRADTLWVSPTMLATLTRIDRSPLGPDYCRRRAVRVFSATAPLPLKIRQEFAGKYGADVIESYGLSELLLITANIGPAGPKLGSVGRSISEADIEIRAEDGKPSSRGEDGGIYVRTPHSAMGYLNYDTGEPGPPPAAWFDTGDVGHVDDEGYLFVTGRKKDLIIRGGFNISPRKIEEVLLQHGGIDDVAVIGAPHDYYGEEVIAAVIMKPGWTISELERELRRLCHRELGPGLGPDRFMCFDKFPVSSTGKVQKRSLREHIISEASR
jgi:acyl-CoA synthetase (AMP-forming)/AMP-acid ligase II